MLNILCKLMCPELQELVSFAEFCAEQRMMLGDLELSQKLKADRKRPPSRCDLNIGAGSLCHGDDFRCS